MSAASAPAPAASSEGAKPKAVLTPQRRAKLWAKIRVVTALCGAARAGADAAEATVATYVASSRAVVDVVDVCAAGSSAWSPPLALALCATPSLDAGPACPPSFPVGPHDGTSAAHGHL